MSGLQIDERIRLAPFILVSVGWIFLFRLNFSTRPRGGVLPLFSSFLVFYYIRTLGLGNSESRSNLVISYERFLRTDNLMIESTLKNRHAELADNLTVPQIFSD